MENFTPYSAVIGGLLIGTAATLMLWANGRIAGISGILGSAIIPVKQDFLWRLYFLLGLLAAPFCYLYIFNQEIEIVPQANSAFTVLAGLLVGVGTRLGSGCTSGHGICGIARFSKRSFMATTIFMLTALVTVFISRHMLGIV